MTFIDEYLDVLYGIESQIVAVYRRNPVMTDYMAMRALEAAIEHYTAKERGRPSRVSGLRDIETEVFQRIVAACDTRLKRTDHETAEKHKPLTVQEVILSLKKVLRSAQFWEKQGGRQNYLQYISIMVP